MSEPAPVNASGDSGVALGDVLGLIMKLQDVLAIASKLENQSVEIEGLLVIGDVNEGEWFLTEPHTSETKERILIDRSIELSAPSYTERTMHLTNSVYSELRVSGITSFQGNISITGKLQLSNNPVALFMVTEIERIVLEKTPKLTLYLQRDITFNDIDIEPLAAVTVPEVANNPTSFVNQVIRLEGVVRGEDFHSKRCCVISKGYYGHRLDEIDHKIDVQKLELVGGDGPIQSRRGGRHAYNEDAQIIGTLVASEHPNFIAALSDVTKLITRSYKQEIRVWDVGDYIPTYGGERPKRMR